MNISKIYSPHVDNSLEINTLAEHDVSCMLCMSVDDPVDDNHNDMLNKNITVSEIRDVINDLPDGKSGGIDGILCEMIQCGTDALITYMHVLFNKILVTGIFPDMWGEAVISRRVRSTSTISHIYDEVC